MLFVVIITYQNVSAFKLATKMIMVFNGDG